MKWQWKKYDSEEKRDVDVYRKRIHVTENKYLEATFKHEITFSHSFVNDSGTYYCHASNTVGKVTSNATSVTVKGRKY